MLLLEVHVPPGVALANLVEMPSQTEVAPVIAETTGNGFTPIVVTALVDEQPFEFVTVKL